VITIDRSAEAGVAAPPAGCLERLADVERYPSWASLIKSAERVGERVRLSAELWGIAFAMDCALQLTSQGAVLRRLPYSADDDERYQASWTVTPEASGSRVELHVVAAVDVPGAARFVRGRIERGLVNDLLEDFASSFQPST
jgi:hypothetical protein